MWLFCSSLLEPGTTPRCPLEQASGPLKSLNSGGLDIGCPSCLQGPFVQEPHVMKVMDLYNYYSKKRMKTVLIIIPRYSLKFLE